MATAGGSAGSGDASWRGPSPPPCPPAQWLMAGMAPPSPAICQRRDPETPQLGLPAAAIRTGRAGCGRDGGCKKQQRLQGPQALLTSNRVSQPPQQHLHPPLHLKPKAKSSIFLERLFPISRHASWPFPGSSRTEEGLHLLKQQPLRSPELGQTCICHTGEKGARIPALHHP